VTQAQRVADSELAFRLEDVGKRFTKYEDQPLLLNSAVRFWLRSKRGKLWAIRNVDLEVKRGERVGVIGRNGSGKSTLLQMLGGITGPTEGRVTVRGRVAPLVAVGVGFHPELTGRENVYVNATILGLTREEIDRRFDAIVAFSEISDFIDTPVKFYSSGMYVRLGFAVAIEASPDILLVDEVLAVGDLPFQIKCFERMQEVADAGTTIVVVSHSLPAVRRLCERTILVDRGHVRFDGETAEAIALYHQLLSEPRELDDPVEFKGYREDRGTIDVLSVRLLDGQNNPSGHFHSGDEVRIAVEMDAHKGVGDAIISLVITSEQGSRLYSEAWALDGDSASSRSGPLSAQLSYLARLATGSYAVRVIVSTPDMGVVYGVVDGGSFFVTGRDRVGGVADLGGSLKVFDRAGLAGQPHDPAGDDSADQVAADRG
jgi:ABC-2 type transport system ATP-binding protein